jgi:DNA-binding MarR family transcriptional regulator
MARVRATKQAGEPADEVGFLLSQVGALVALGFKERLAQLDLVPAHAGILKVIDQSDGLSQQSLGERLGVFPSRLVSMLDELEERGLIERRNNPADRRSYSLFLTTAGLASLREIERIGRANQDVVCAALDSSERGQLASLLARIAEQQRLTPGVHPGFRWLGTAK